MKNSNWLDVTEYLLLVGSGVGSLAAIASQQIAFTAAPLSLLMAVNMVNRRRLDLEVQTEAASSIHQLDQRLSKGINKLDRQVQASPKMADLKNLHKHIQAQQTAIGQAVAQRLEALEACNLTQMQHDLSHLQGNYAHLTDTVATVTADLNRLATLHQVEEAEVAIAQLTQEVGNLRATLSEVPTTLKQTSPRALQDQIDHLNRRFNNLPQPFDANSLKQDVAGLIKLMGDMVSRRELAKMMTEVEKIRQQHQIIEQTVAPIRAVNTIMRKQMDTLATWVQQKDTVPLRDEITDEGELTELTELRRVIALLEARLDRIPLEVAGDFSQFQTDVRAISTHLEDLQAQISHVEQSTQILDRHQKTLGEWVQHLPQILDSSALQSQIRYLTTRMELSESNVVDLQNQILALVEGAAGTVSPPSPPTAAYELLFDLRSGQDSTPTTAPANSQMFLEAAFAAAQSRIVIVFPYPDLALLKANLMHQFQAFLARGGNLDIGWGHLDHLQPQQSRYMHQNQLQPHAHKGALQEILSQLTDLKRRYPQQFRFKVLGTDENFLICDDRYALLGIHPMPIASAVFPQVAVGLRTTQAEVIQRLTARFNDPTLEADDAVSYFNRAITRYELGDKQGAIADYTQVLRIDSNHDVAYNNRALVHYELGNTAAAIADFERALLANSHNAIAYCNRGIVRAEVNNRLGAIADYSSAIQVDADCLPAYFQRGLARNRMGNKMGAIADFGEVIRINLEDASAFFYRGLAKTKLGDRIGAIRDLKEAAWLFSAQGNEMGNQQATAAMSKLRKRLVLASSSNGKRA